MINTIVRTWYETPSGTETYFGEVELPPDVVIRILDWAKSQQVMLLDRKYRDRGKHLAEASSQTWEACTSSNEIFLQLQREGYRSSDEIEAINYLIQLYTDNPELIDLSVALEFLKPDQDAIATG